MSPGVTGERLPIARGITALLLLLLAAVVTGIAGASIAANPAAQGRGGLLGQVPNLSPNGQRVVMLMIDGLAVRPFEAALAAGKLPNLSRLANSRPGVQLQAIATFPSATSPSVPELLSGRYAAIENLGAPGAVHAFDRQERRVIRYVTHPDAWQWPIVTLFDATRGLPAITVFEGRWDGPKSVLTQFSVARQAVLEIIGAHGLAEGDRGPVEAYLKAVRSAEPPAVSFVVLNDFDMAAHFYGPESPQANEALVLADRLLGEIVDTLAQIPGTTAPTLLEETNFIIFGDHGHVASGNFVDLQKFFGERGVDAVDVSTIGHVLFRESLGSLWTEWPDAILVSGGSNISQVYLRNFSGGWRSMAPPEDGGANGTWNRAGLDSLVTAITELDGVGQVLWQPVNGETWIAASGGRSARVLVLEEGQRKRFAYVIPGDARDDPLGYALEASTRPLVCREGHVDHSCYYSLDQWFDLTFDSRYPAAVPLIPKAFHPRRFTGDLMVTLEPGYSFIREQRGDHGNLERDAIITPLILNGPAIKPSRERHRPRLVDLYPSVAVMLGADPRDAAFDDLDGRVLDCISAPPRRQEP